MIKRVKAKCLLKLAISQFKMAEMLNAAKILFHH